MSKRDSSKAQIAPEYAQASTPRPDLAHGREEESLQRKIAELEAQVVHLRKVGGVREPQKGFGGTIQRLRERKNLSLTELAQLSGFSKPSLSRIEQLDDPNVKLRSILKLARGLGLRPSEMFAEYELQNPPNNGK